MSFFVAISVILALIVAQWVQQATSVIAFTVITINALYYGAHRVLEQKLQFDNVLDTKL